MEHLMAIVLAAGEGKRMKSRNSKVMQMMCGKPLINWIYSAAKQAGISETVIVVGHRADQVMDYMGEGPHFAMQEQQLGTGHAVMQAEQYLKGKSGYVVILYGDTPLVTSDTITKAVDFHKSTGNAATVITADLPDPAGYGRILRNASGDFVRIVEHKDATEEEKKITEVNSGLYCFTIQHLEQSLKLLDNNNKQGEYYLTDILEILKRKELKVGAIKISDGNEILGINDRVQLAQASEIQRKRIAERLMKSGVGIIDPTSTYIDDEAVIGMDTVIYPGTIIQGKTVIGENCIIGPYSRLVSSSIGNGVEVSNSVILESTVEDKAHVGPFAYIRPQSIIHSNVKIGDFVEVKKSEIGKDTKISHLTYVGDSEVGENVNLGCGVVTVNYDGKRKHKTIIGDNSFIGCNVNLVAPVEVKENSYIAAGSTITDTVPENSLAIARQRQVIKEDWVTKKGLSRKKQ